MSHLTSLVNFYCAKKGSGKTYDLGSSIQKLLDGNKITQAYIFCSTAEIDPSWKRIRKMLKKADIPYEIYDGIISREIDGRGREVKINNLQEVLADLIPKKNEVLPPVEEEYKYDPVRNVWIYRGTLVLSQHFNPSLVGGLTKQKVKSEPEPVSPLFLFDDLSKRELRGIDLYSFLKKSRHYGLNKGTCYAYICSQFPTDLAPESWGQINRLIIFRGFPENYIKKIHSNCQLSIPLNEFLAEYKERTKEQYSKMEIDLSNDRIL